MGERAGAAIERKHRVKIVTYNVNGIRARLERLVEYLSEQQPDVVCLQELKAADDEIGRAHV